MTVVSIEKQGDIAVVTVDNPPVNALSQALRQGLWDAAEALDADPGVRAVVLACAGRTFIAGADVTEFGKPPVPPHLPDLVARIEAAAKPWVAAIHGSALGGGLEVALGCRFRVAAADASLGLPEVTLGIVPGAGGTVRTPRLVGVEAAVDLVTTGKPVRAARAQALGLVDAVIEGDLLPGALAFAAEALTRPLPAPLSARAVAAPEPGFWDRAEQATAKAAKGAAAPLRALACLRKAAEVSFDQAMAFERETFLDLRGSTQAAALRHVFFAERAAPRPAALRDIDPLPLARVAVIGGGTMGAGITVSALDAGLVVTMIERDAESIARGQANVEKVYNGLIAKGRMSEEAKAAIMARYTPSTRYDDIADVDLVIEAVFEDLQVKKAVFKELDRVCKSGAVLATNTSYLDIDAIAAVTSRPQDVIGLHFFSPANIMKLLEIVVPAKVAPDVVTTAFELAKKMKKVPVRAGVCDGFIGNRILATYKQAADYLMEDGASPYEIDEAVRGFGFAMGPFQVTDLAGGDIGWATRKRRAATRDPKARYVEIADRICENGWFGQKTGRGFYLYPQGARIGQPDPEVLAIVDAERAKKGVTPRSFTAEEIMRRYMAAMVNEGAKVVGEGIALRPLDVDVTFISGYGFPRHRGGPMKWADMQGLPKVLADIEAFAREDALFWKPAPLLQKLVAEGRNFESLNK